MVGEATREVYLHFACPRRDVRRRDLIIDSPAYVFRPRLPAVIPPSVLVGTLIHAAENVRPAKFVEHQCQPLTLFRQEAGIPAITPPVLEIDFFVRDVPVATKNEFAARRRQLLEMR